MTPEDYKPIFTALGFLAVILRDVPQDKQALRAAAIAELMENFCMTPPSQDIQTIINNFERTLKTDPAKT